MKKHNLLKILLLTTLGVLLLTWLLPITYYNDGIATAAREPAGIFDFFGYPVQALYYFGQVLIFVLVVGGFYGVLSKTGAYRNVLDKIVKGFKGKENIFLILTVVILSALVSAVGFNITILFFLPLVVSLILLMGYNKIVAALVVIGSYTVGMIGATYTNLLDAYNKLISTNYSDEILSKIILLVLGIVLLSFNLIVYTSKNKKEKDTTLEANLIPEKLEKKRKKWPLIVIIDLMVLTMILGFMNWTGAFGIDLFADIHKSVTEFHFGDSKFTLFGNLIGQVGALGTWTEAEAITVVLLSTLIIGLIYKMKISDIFTAFKDGAKKFVYPVVIMLFIFSILMMITIHPVVLTILKPILELTKGFNIVTTSFAAFVASAFNGQSYYTINGIVPYLVKIANDKELSPLIMIITQSMYGIVQLILPTGVILVCTLSYLDIPYTTWLKNVWKFLVQLLVIVFIVFIIILMV